MIGKFWKKKNKPEEKKNEAEHVSNEGFEAPKWYEVGEGNPFNDRILDIRSVTLNIVATTREKSIAENYTNSRSDTGEKFIGCDIPGSSQYSCDIHYPHNGEKLSGVVSKAESMDVKWDIYAYDDWFYFVRSWTSELVYKVHYQNTGTELILDSIVTANEGDGSLHEQNIHSTMLTHALGRPWPYTIPGEFLGSSEQDIALYLFSQFGCKATIATTANILELKIVEK